MSDTRMQGKNVIVTQCKDYMGPAMIEFFERAGANVLADASDLREPGTCQALVGKLDRVDVLIANMAPVRDPLADAVGTDDDLWHYMFDMMVHPLHRLTRALLPQMYARREGKIIVVGSATGLKTEHTPGKTATAYTAARTAQVGYVRAVGVEAAPHNVQINLIAQHFTYSATFFPVEYQQTDEFKSWIKSTPGHRLATGEEDAELALFLASDKSNFINGTSIPFCGGWHL